MRLRWNRLLLAPETPPEDAGGAAGAPPDLGDFPDGDDAMAAFMDERASSRLNEDGGDEGKSDETSEEGETEDATGESNGDEGISSESGEDERPGSEDGDAADDDGGESGGEDDEDDDGDGSGSPIDRDRLRQLRQDGKLDEALKEVFGDDFDLEKETKVGVKDYRALRKREKKMLTKVAEQEQAVTQREEQFQSQLETVVQKLQPAAEFFKAQQALTETGDVDAFVAAIEKASGMTFQDLQQAYITGGKGEGQRGADPQMRALMRQVKDLQTKLAEQDKPKEPTEEERQAEQQKAWQAYYTHLESELEDHPVLKLDTWKADVTKVLQDSLDPKLKKVTLSPEEAADRVIERYRRLAKKLGMAAPASGEKTKGKGKDKPGRVKGTNRDRANAAQDDDGDPDGLDATEIALRNIRRKMRERAQRGDD